MMVICRLTSLFLFNSSVFLSQFNLLSDYDSAKAVLPSRTKKRSSFKIEEKDVRSLSATFSQFCLFCLFQSLKFCIYSNLFPALSLLVFEDFSLLYSPADLLFHSFIQFQLIFPYLFLYGYERHRLSWLLRIRSWQSRNFQTSSPPAQTLPWIVKVFQYLLEKELEVVTRCRGKHSFGSMACILAVTAGIAMELFWSTVSPHLVRMISRYYASLYLILMSLFRFLSL